MNKALTAKPTLLTRSLTLLLGICAALACISGMVLLLHGHMAALMPTLALVSLGQLVFPFILLPASMMAGLWHALHAHKAKAVVRFFAVASVGYIAAIMSATVWVQAAFLDELLETEPALFVGMFLVTGSLSPWTIFALRDRGNQLFIVMLWAMLVGCTVMLPLYLTLSIGPFFYAFSVWMIMLLILFVENIRETSRARKIEAARVQAEAAAAAATAATTPVREDK